MLKILKPEYKTYKYILPEHIPQKIENYCQSDTWYKKPETGYFKYAFIIDTITRHTSTYLLQGKNYDDYDGCPLHMKTLSSILGTKDEDTCQFIQKLISREIIKRVGGYMSGVNSYHYTLTDKPLEFVSITALPKFTKIPEKIITRRNLMYATATRNLKLYKKHIEKITLDIKENENLTETVSRNYDIYSNINNVYENYNETSLSIHNTPMIGTFSQTRTAKAFHVQKFVSKYVVIERIINMNVQALQAIIDKDWYVHRINNKSRVYTNLTNLKREFRKLLQYDGKSLVELDIRNSQPLIASILIKDYYKAKELPPDAIQYQKDCEAGIFYDDLMKINNIEETQEARSAFKVQLFAEVFFSKVSKRFTTLKKQFIEKYPSVYEAICYIKGGLGSRHYNKFAILLQGKEAEIIFDDVNMGLLKDGIPAFNIFDSILCLPEHKEIAKERMMQAFLKYELTPTINFKNDVSIEAHTVIKNNFTMITTDTDLNPNNKPEERFNDKSLGMNNWAYYKNYWANLVGLETAKEMYEDQFTKAKKLLKEKEDVESFNCEEPATEYRKPIYKLRAV